MSIPILIDNNNNIDIDNGDFRAILRISRGKIRIVLGEDNNGDYYGMQKYWQFVIVTWSGASNLLYSN